MFLFVLVGYSTENTSQPMQTECKPEVIVKEIIMVEEKPVIQEKIVYKNKVVYKDKIIYRDKKSNKCSCSNDKPIIGRVEYIHVVSADITQKAKIDTGAKTTSIDAKDILRFERDGKEWVKFKFANKIIEKPLVKDIFIKRHGTKSQERPVIQLRLKLGDISRNVNVTLANRSKYIYPILIGRNFIKDAFLVDVSQTYTIDKNFSAKEQ